MVEGFFRGKKMRIESACIAPFRAYASCNPTRANALQGKKKAPDALHSVSGATKEVVDSFCVGLN